ncbi:unnamed protein product [Lathyrus oleraceus]
MMVVEGLVLQQGIALLFHDIPRHIWYGFAGIITVDEIQDAKGHGSCKWRSSTVPITKKQPATAALKPTEIPAAAIHLQVVEIAAFGSVLKLCYRFFCRASKGLLLFLSNRDRCHRRHSLPMNRCSSGFLISCESFLL